MATGTYGLPTKIAEDLKPRLKIFLSADLIGSTAYKQPLFDGKSGRANAEWPVKIEKFYQAMNAAFTRQWESLKTSFSASDDLKDSEKFFGDDFRYWKTIGDEVVYWKELTSEYQVWTIIMAWMAAIDEVRLETLKDSPLDIKSAVWCAGFPVRNRAISLVDDSILKNGKITKRDIVQDFYKSRKFNGNVDFIGAGIDVGFRLGALASSRKMIVSVDTAYLMASCEAQMNGFRDGVRPETLSPTIGRKCQKSSDQIFGGKLRIYYSGTEILRGVMGEVRYPKFWINIEKSGSIESVKSDINEEYLRSSDWKQISAYCKSFYDDRRNFVFSPFIFDSEKSSVTYNRDIWKTSYFDIWCDAVESIDPNLVKSLRPDQ